MQDFSVTVVVPTLNEEDFLARCLRSIKNLEYPAELLKLIVVDNGSQDKTKEIANQYADIVLDIPPKSIANTRNSGAAETDSEIIAFVDADIVVHPKWLSNAIQHFSDPQVIAVGSYPEVIKEESNRLQQTWSKLCRRVSKQAAPVEWLASANLIIRRSAFAQAGGFNEKLTTCEDSDLGYRLKNIGKIIDDPGILAYHLREPKTFWEFFKKEIWHSYGNLSGAFQHGFELREMPSLIFPAIFGVGICICVFSPFLGKTVFTTGCIMMIFPLGFYVFRGRRKTGGTGYIFCIYFIYLTARFVSILRDFLKLLSFKKFNH